MWNAVCCEIQGRGHIKTDTPCQDKTKRLLKDNVNVIVLADGAGSAKLSHYGAECVVNCVSAYVADNFLQIIENSDGKQVKRDFIEKIRSALTVKAIELNCSINDLASTVLLAAVTDEKFIILGMYLT